MAYTTSISDRANVSDNLNYSGLQRRIRRNHLSPKSSPLSDIDWGDYEETDEPEWRKAGLEQEIKSLVPQYNGNFNGNETYKITVPTMMYGPVEHLITVHNRDIPEINVCATNQLQDYGPLCEYLEKKTKEVLQEGSKSDL